MLYLFYQEPDPDSLVKYDRYPRMVIRRLWRGAAPIGGMKKWFINLIKGLDEMGVPYAVNDFRAVNKKGLGPALVIGKPHVIDKIADGVPIVYGPAVASHPSENDFWDKKNIRCVLLSC